MNIIHVYVNQIHKKIENLLITYDLLIAFETFSFFVAAIFKEFHFRP